MMMMVCQIDLSVHLFMCDGTNQMHELKITDEFYRSRFEIYTYWPAFHAEPQRFCEKRKKDEFDGGAEKVTKIK